MAKKTLLTTAVPAERIDPFAALLLDRVGPLVEDWSDRRSRRFVLQRQVPGHRAPDELDLAVSCYMQGLQDAAQALATSGVTLNWDDQH
jgi:hypothetical protein